MILHAQQAHILSNEKRFALGNFALMEVISSPRFARGDRIIRQKSKELFSSGACLLSTFDPVTEKLDAHQSRETLWVTSSRGASIGVLDRVGFATLRPSHPKCLAESDARPLILACAYPMKTLRFELVGSILSRG